jgi:hypothetical protein
MPVSRGHLANQRGRFHTVPTANEQIAEEIRKRTADMIAVDHPRFYVLKKTAQTIPRMITASPTLATRIAKTLGPGSA